jgi:catechol 2,3-dioxygenase-like lactoylglutathione lyase family enzyme
MASSSKATMKIWTLGAKVADLDAEVAFLRELGAVPVLDEILTVDIRSIRVVLIRWADKYLHLFTSAVYEAQLGKEIGAGLCHVVFETDDFAGQREHALQGGAREIMPPQRITAGFGIRDVCFLESPGGILFELIHIHENCVPDLNAGNAGEEK